MGCLSVGEKVPPSPAPFCPQQPVSHSAALPLAEGEGRGEGEVITDTGSPRFMGRLAIKLSLQ